MAAVVFAPSGSAIVGVLTDTFNTETVTEWSEEGDIDGSEGTSWGGNGPEYLHGLCSSPVVVDVQDHEFLLRHCEVLECSSEQAKAFDAWNSSPDHEIEPWPSELKDMACRAAVISPGARKLRALLDNRGFWPADYITSTVETAVKHLLLDRVEAEMREIDAAITAWKEARDPVRLPDCLLEPTIPEEEA